MDTELVLDLFRHTSAEEDAANAKKDKDQTGPANPRNLLHGLEDLPTEEEYQDLDVSSFMSSLGR